jgi:hypothetical protein
VCVFFLEVQQKRGQGGFETINIRIFLCFSFWPSWMLEKLFAFFLIQLGRERQVEERNKQKNRELF